MNIQRNKDIFEHVTNLLINLKKSYCYLYTVSVNTKSTCVHIQILE